MNGRPDTGHNTASPQPSPQPRYWTAASRLASLANTSKTIAQQLTLLFGARRIEAMTTDTDAKSGAQHADRRAWTLPVGAILIAGTAAGASEAFQSYGATLIVVCLAYLLFSLGALRASGAAPDRVPEAIASLSVGIAVLMVCAWGMSFMGIRFGAFESGEYVEISIAYFATAGLLLICGVFARRSALARGIALTLLAGIGIAAGFCSAAIIQLLIEVPGIFSEHLSEPIQSHFYNTLILFFAILGTGTIATGLLRVAWLARSGNTGKIDT